MVHKKHLPCQNYLLFQRFIWVGNIVAETYDLIQWSVLKRQCRKIIYLKRVQRVLRPRPEAVKTKVCNIRKIPSRGQEIPARDPPPALCAPLPHAKQLISRTRANLQQLPLFLPHTDQLIGVRRQRRQLAITLVITLLLLRSHQLICLLLLPRDTQLISR